jgi:2-(1,2-epoxy-1,2-dihydrophenyl)acetyl-CoA isomerase
MPLRKAAGCAGGAAAGIAIALTDLGTPAILAIDMKELETLLYSESEGVATVSLNRPESFNALNETICFELQDVFRAIADSDAVRAVILTGEGRAFSAGQDLRSMETDGADAADFVKEVLRRRYAPLITGMRSLPKPIVGAINGVAAGAGMSLALATDVRIASDKSSFMQAFSRVGLVPDAGSNYFLVQLVGLPRALELAWTARRVGAAEALELGLVNRVVPEAELQGAAREMATSLARGPAQAIALTKQAMTRATTADLAEILDLEAELQARCIVTDDFQEGVAAFLEKREPRFGQTPSRI